MPRATNVDGSLAVLDKCKIITPCGTICLKILPDISDSKSSHYTQEQIPGRSSPIINYAYSEPRQITTDLHFMITKTDDINDNWRSLKIIQSLVYPQKAGGGAPFKPPPTVRFVCGDLLDGPNGLCMILKSYSVRYPTEVAWEKQTYLPYRFTITCTWEIIFPCKDLPSNTCTIPCLPGSCEPYTGGMIPSVPPAGGK